MARVYCNSKLMDVWSKDYQEWLVNKYGHEVQVRKAVCEAVKPTPEEAYGDGSQYIIKT